MGPGTPGPSSHYHSGLFTPPRGKNHFQGPQGPPATITVDYSPLRGGKITSRDPRALQPLSQWTIPPSEGEKSLPGTPGPSSHSREPCDLILVNVPPTSKLPLFYNNK